MLVRAEPQRVQHEGRHLPELRHHGDRGRYLAASLHLSHREGGGAAPSSSPQQLLGAWPASLPSCPLCWGAVVSATHSKTPSTRLRYSLTLTVNTKHSITISLPLSRQTPSTAPPTLTANSKHSPSNSHGKLQAQPLQFSRQTPSTAPPTLTANSKHSPSNSHGKLTVVVVGRGGGAEMNTTHSKLPIVSTGLQYSLVPVPRKQSGFCGR